MKRCPTCNQQFADEYDFCLEDGTPLVSAGMRISYGDETPTVVAQRVPPQPTAQKSSVPVLMWLLPVLGLVLGAMAFGGFYAVSKLAGGSSNNKANLTTPTPNIFSNNGSPTPTPSSSPTSSPSSSVTPQPSPTPRPTDTPPARSSYPSTTRLNFARGAYSTSYGGDLNANDSRSLVLACSYGQRLTASVSSSDNCVTFSSGGTSYSATTTGGDNYIRLSNRCGSLSRFRITVTIV